MAAVARGNIPIGGSNMYIMCGMYPMPDEHRLSASPLHGSAPCRLAPWMLCAAGMLPKHSRGPPDWVWGLSLHP